MYYYIYDEPPEINVTVSRDHALSHWMKRYFHYFQNICNPNNAFETERLLTFILQNGNLALKNLRLLVLHTHFGSGHGFIQRWTVQVCYSFLYCNHYIIWQFIAYRQLYFFCQILTATWFFLYTFFSAYT